MPDQHFVMCLRDRLLLSVCQEGARCQHRRRDGRLCNALLDSRGHHARKCCIGGALGARHDRLRDRVAKSWADLTTVPAHTEQRVPEWDREVLDEDTGRMVREEAVLDVVTTAPSTGQVAFVDVTVTTACPDDAVRLRSRARHDGRGAADAAADKRRRYDRAGANLVPMAFEDGGRPAEETVAFVRRCGAAADRVDPLREESGEQPVVARLW